VAFIGAITGVPRIVSAGQGAPAQLIVSPIAAIRNIPRIGINLNSRTSWGAEQFSSNVIMNPGFEPTIDRTVVIVNKRLPTGFSDNESWLGRPDHFWRGATFQVLTGVSAGRSGVIRNSNRQGSDELPWFVTRRPAPELAKGDVIAVTQIQSSDPPANWWVGSSTTCAINTSDHRPGSPGHSVAELTLKRGQQSQLDSYFDSGYQMGGSNFLPVNGAWQLSLWARATAGGGANLAVTFRRLNGTAPFVAQNVRLTDRWQHIIFNFSARDRGPAGPLDLQFIATGNVDAIAHTASVPIDGTVRLDDVQLGSVSELASGVWRGPVVETLVALHPGYLRDWQGQLGDTMSNRLASAFGRGPTRYVPDPSNNLQTFLYSLPDFLDLCHRVGARPWIVLPTTFYDSEFSAFGKYLARVQARFKFDEIVVEFGNENWNAVFRAGGIENPVTMGQAANRGFGLLRTAAGSHVPLHLVVNGQFANPWIGQQALANASEANAVDAAPYYFYSLNAADTEVSALSSMFNLDDENSNLSRFHKIATTAHKDVDIYEVNASTFHGDAPAAERDRYVTGMASGAALANRLIAGTHAGVFRQLVFDLAQYSYKMSAGKGDVMLWGITNSLAHAGAFRPTGLALELLNSAIGGDYHTAATNAPGVSAAAFLTRTGWSVAIVSANAAPTSLVLKLPSDAAKPLRSFVLSGSSLTASNDVSADNPGGLRQVSIEKATLDGNEITVPPYGLMVLLPPDAPEPKFTTWEGLQAASIAGARDVGSH
jgi:hypothetical protein